MFMFRKKVLVNIKLNFVCHIDNIIKAKCDVDVVCS